MQLNSIRYGDAGSPVAFLHGVFGQAKNWASIGRVLSDDHRVILVDLPNHGRSPWTQTMSYQQMANQTAEFLERDAPLDLVGHSMGGKVAMLLALQHRELVKRLCIVDVAPVAYRGHRDFNRYVEAMLQLDLDSLKTRQEADDALLEAAPQRSVREFLLQNLRRTPHRDPGLRHAGEHSRWRWQANLELIGTEMTAIAGWPEDVDVSPFFGPVLWVAGADSNYIKPEYAEAMRRYFPRMHQVTIPGAAHWVHSEQPAAFLNALRHFLDG